MTLEFYGGLEGGFVFTDDSVLADVDSRYIGPPTGALATGAVGWFWYDDLGSIRFVFGISQTAWDALPQRVPAEWNVDELVDRRPTDDISLEIVDEVILVPLKHFVPIAE